MRVKREEYPVARHSEFFPQEVRLSGLETVLLSSAAKEAAAPAKSLISKLGKKAFDELIVAYTNSFRDHVEFAQGRCSRIKNILYRDQSVFLLDQYVNVNLVTGRREDSVETDLEIVTRLIGGARILVSGTAGAGKTMFMKWATLSLINTKENHNRIPLFLELRYYSDEDSADDLAGYLLHKTGTAENRVSRAQFEIGLREGIFVIILDAVDEISPSIRDRMIKKIREFLSLYPKCAVLISTRPDDSLESLQDLRVVRTSPMSLEQVTSVLEKLEYDQSVKSRLISDLSSGLYQKHKGFLSNPLLVTIMLLTYDHAADIPTKLSSFYRQAFEALYQRHDAAKGTYRRGHHAALPLDEYTRVFSTFCYQTYVASKYEFSDGELLSEFREAAKYTEINKDASLLVKDAMESICVIQKEGLDNVFVHRSFQEYFAAVFVSEYHDSDVYEVIDSIYEDVTGGNALRMLMEIKPTLVETEWMLPRMDRWLAVTSRLNLKTKTGLRKLLAVTAPELDVDPTTANVSMFPLIEGEFSTWLHAIEPFYPERMFFDSLFSEEGTLDELSLPHLLATSSEIETATLEKALGRRHSMEDDDGTEHEYLSVSPKDAEWLVRTNFVRRVEALREAVQGFADTVRKKHEARRTTIRGIRKRASDQS